MTRYINRTTAVIAIAAVGAASAILLAAALIPNPVSAFGPGRWMHDGGYGGYGPGHISGGMYEGNWTGSVSVDSVRQDLIESLKEKVNVTVSDAESAAKQTLGEGSEVCCVTLAPVNGYIVYLVHGIDSDNQPHKVIVDAGDGKVLDSAKVDMGRFGGWHARGFEGGMWQ